MPQEEARNGVTRRMRILEKQAGQRAEEQTTTLTKLLGASMSAKVSLPGQASFPGRGPCGWTHRWVSISILLQK